MKNSWMLWMQTLFIKHSPSIENASIRILGEETCTAKVHANIRDNGNLEGIGIYSTSDKWSGFYIVMDLSVIHKIKIVQDSINTDYGDDDLAFNDENKRDVFTFLKNAVDQGWRETTFYYKGDPYKVQFTFGNDMRIELSEFIYPLTELDYPLFGTKIYRFYYHFIEKFAHERITMRELIVQGLSISKLKNEY
ncbi:hypothetical protein G3O08_20185 [Cryomorpha ignava]|uniref:Uncharacterized protein n=1 Tax=Cryomorpha ignava TaxID=101383 RepID=A0A7K3WY75_9FLAO|nr:hypothetical protein [Cryomorpha ignava]NEN25812.1 hypothetical protein [Cryomorpha ignava]